MLRRAALERDEGTEGRRDADEDSIPASLRPSVPSPLLPGQTDLASLFRQVTSTLARRSLVVLVSDLFDDPEHLAKGCAQLAFAGHDLIVLQVLDPAERTFPFRHPSEFLGLEAEGRLPLDPHALRQAYLDVFEAHQRRIAEIARRFRFDHLLLDTSESLGPAMSEFLARRAALVSKRKVSQASRGGSPRPTAPTRGGSLWNFPPSRHAAARCEFPHRLDTRRPASSSPPVISRASVVGSGNSCAPTSSASP